MPAAPPPPTVPPVEAFPTFVNTVYPSQRVTLTDIPEGTDRRKVPVHRTITFVPQRVGTREEGDRTVPIIHGFYTPRDAEELAALRHVCALGYCSAREENADLKRARELLQEEERRQAVQMGR